MLIKNAARFLTAIVLLTFLCEGAWCQPAPQPQPLSTSLHGAQIIVLAKLESFKLDEHGFDMDHASQSEIALALTASYPAGMYEFNSVKVLKGNTFSDNSLKLYLPIISKICYGSKVTLSKGSYVLLLLNKNKSNQLVPVDQALPLIPLGSGIIITLVPKANFVEVENFAISSMLTTLDDPLLRRVNMYLLRSVVNHQLPAKLIAFEGDADLDFRDDVLYCLITNQQVQAIPLMAVLSELCLKKTGGSASVEAFQSLKTREAVPYLNPLLLNVSPSTRQATAFALRKLADRTSLPFLFKALEQPDPQGITVYEVYATLHRLLPRLGTTKTLPAFLDQRKSILAATRSWWTKHQQEFTPEATSAPSKT